MGERMRRREIRDSHRTQGTTSRSKLPNSPWTFYQIIRVRPVAIAADARIRIIPKLTAARLPSLAWHIVPVTVVSVLYVVVGVSFRTGWLY
jgi:hypothetical protein